MLSVTHVVTTFLIIILLLYSYYSQSIISSFTRKISRKDRWKSARIDRHWDPILGLDFVISTMHACRGKYQLRDLQERFSSIGRTFTSNFLGHVWIFTDEPKNAQAVLATQFDDFDVGELRRQCTVKLLGHGIFNADGPYWQHSRALIRPNFVRNQVADLSMMERHVRRMMSYFPTDGTPFDIQPFFFRLTLDTATEFLFGRSIESLRPDATAESKRFYWAFGYALGAIAQKMRLGKFHWIYQDRKYDEACNYIHDYVRPIVANAVTFRQSTSYKDEDVAVVSEDVTMMEANRDAKIPEDPLTLSSKERCLEHGGEERYVFLHELAKQTGCEDELRDQIINTLIAGRDTTASLLSSTIFVLSRRDDVWRKIRTEIGSLGAKSPTFTQIKELKYLQYVIQEVLRMYPVIPLNVKIANKDTFLPRGGGRHGDDPIFVHKGQTIVWVPYSMHRREDLWGADAAEFKPERWEGLRAGFKFLPFNGGPRTCPGQQFAMTEASFTIVKLCQTFSKIEVVPGQEDRPWEEKLNLTCSVAGGVNVRCWK